MSDHAKRRTLILRAAARLLEHYGVHKTTVADIAREASVGVGTVYLEFGSKDDILSQVARERHDGILQRLHDAADGAATHADRIRAIIDERVNAFHSLAECGTHAAELVHCQCSPIEAAWRRYRDEEWSLLREVIGEGMESGEFVAGDPDEVTEAVLAAYGKFTAPMIFRVEDLDACIRRLNALHDIVLRGVSA